MSNKDEDFKRQLHLTIQKSHRLLKTARVDFMSGDYDSASSRAYYAVFHILEGALLLKGLTYSKHSAVISAFNLHFIKPGIFPDLVSLLRFSLSRDSSAIMMLKQILKIKRPKGILNSP